MKTPSIPILALPMAAGLSLGLYAWGWLNLAVSGYAQVVSHSWTGLAWASAGGLAICWGWFQLNAALGRKLLGMGESRARFWAAATDLPLVMLGLGVALYPWLVRFGSGVTLDVLGQIRLPGMQGFVFLPPAAYLYLLWAGPWLTLTLFLKLGLGVYHHLRYLRQQSPDAASQSPKPLLLFILAAAFYLLLGCWTTTVYPPTGDEPHYLLMMHSLLHEGDLDLADNMQRLDFREFYPAQALDFHGAAAAKGKLLSKHFPALAFLLLPGYAVLGRFGAVLLVNLLAAGIAVFIYLLARRSGLSTAHSLAAWAWVVLCPPLAVYFDLVYTELPASLLFLLGAWFWQQGQARGILLAALAAVLLPWFYPKYIPLAAVLGLALPWAKGAKAGHLAWAGLLALVSGAAYLFVFGNLYAYSMGDNPFGAVHYPWSWHALTNALGLLADRDYGILATAPMLLLGCVGLMISWRQGRGLARLAAAALAVQFVLFALFDDFTGSSAVFSRHILPGTLLLWVFAPLGWERLSKPGGWRRLAAEICLAVSLAVAWVCAANPLLRYLSPKQLLWSKLGFAPYVFPSLALHPDIGHALWALAWVGLLAWLVIAAGAFPRRES